MLLDPFDQVQGKLARAREHHVEELVARLQLVQGVEVVLVRTGKVTGGSGRGRRVASHGVLLQPILALCRGFGRDTRRRACPIVSERTRCLGPPFATEARGARAAGALAAPGLSGREWTVGRRGPY